MDEPLLPQILVETSTRSPDADSHTSANKKNVIRSTQTFKKKFPSGYLDRRTLRSQSNARFRRTDSILPLLANLRSDSIHATSSAPNLFLDEKGFVPKTTTKKTTRSPRLMKVTLICLLLYIITGILVFIYTGQMFKGERTHKVIDAMYFSVVTLCTIGYGDIVPSTPFSKMFTCVFILFGFGFIDILLNGLLKYALDKQEEVLLGAVDRTHFNKMVRKYIIDKEKGRLRIRIKMCLALGVVVVCLGVGTVTVRYLEDMTWVDSFYLSVTSVTTVGYGDYSFKTGKGRCFAVVWLLASTMAVARAFLYLTEYRMESRNRRMARDVLHRKLTPGDLMAADMDHDGSVSKPEFIIFKLREMGMIEEKDIEQICKQFDDLDASCTGKITIADVIGDHASKDLRPER